MSTNLQRDVLSPAAAFSMRSNMLSETVISTYEATWRRVDEHWVLIFEGPRTLKFISRVRRNFVLFNLVFRNLTVHVYSDMKDKC
jgi:hypothetical protein